MIWYNTSIWGLSTFFKNNARDLVYPVTNSRQCMGNFEKSDWVVLGVWKLKNTEVSRKIKTQDWCIIQRTKMYNLPLPVLSLTRVGLLEKLLRTSRLRPNFSWMNSESSSHVTPLPSTDNAKDNWYSKWKKLKLFLFIFSLNTQGQRQWTERNEKCKMQKH